LLSSLKVKKVSMNKIINSSGFKFSWKNYTTKPDKRSDDYFDMRKWQKHAFDVLHSDKYMILNAPTGSGKSWLICLLSDFKLRKNNNLRCIITVPQTIIANGFSKAFAMTGWRIGIAIGPEDVIAKMSLLLQTTSSCVTPFIQYAALEAITGNQDQVKVMDIAELIDQSSNVGG
jgi:replicative superfamily II helicase